MIRTLTAAVERWAARAESLVAPAPAAALAVLLLNDLYLKPRFGNLLTGKLSDFAGLFLFTAFWMAMAPRWRRAVPWAVCAAWICWKTPLSQPLLAAWNSLGWLPLARVEDASDLLALVMVPLAADWRAPRLPGGMMRRAAGAALAVACVVSFAATSVYRPHAVPLPAAEYRFPLERVQLLTLIHTLRLDYADQATPPRSQGDRADTVRITLPPGSDHAPEAYEPWREPFVTFEVADAPGGSIIRLMEASAYPLLLPDTVRRRFEERVIERLIRGETSPHVRPPFTAGADEHFRPRIRHPMTTAESREQVSVSLARVAHVALIEISPEASWEVIYPTATEESALPAGTSTVQTRCADEICPREAPMSPRDAPIRPRYYPGQKPWGRRLLILAADAPIDPGALQALLDQPDFPRDSDLSNPTVQTRLGRFVRSGGGHRAAASEVVLRR